MVTCTPVRLLALCALLALAACGSNDPDTVGTGDSGGASGGAVRIESDPTPADGVDLTQPFGAQAPKAESTGSFTLLADRPAGYDATAGTATVLRSAGGTVLDVTFTGLKAGAAVVGHVHLQTCADAQGGPHFRFSPSGPAEPPNEIHVSFTVGADGSGRASARNDAVLPVSGRSVVVHEAGVENPLKIACADLG